MADFMTKEQPHFPHFKPIELDDHAVIHNHLWKYQPSISEYTFTNLFIWRHFYNFRWCINKGHLLITGYKDSTHFGYQPIGPSPRINSTKELLEWLMEQPNSSEPYIMRADSRMAAEINDHPSLTIKPARDDYDYLYVTKDLSELRGRRFHSKRNHIKRFKKDHRYEYRLLTTDVIGGCKELANRWCSARNCTKDYRLCSELKAVHDLLDHFDDLCIQGGVILVEGNVEAFAAGELLNETTAVIHVEKANSARGAYAVINQQFADHQWKNTDFINREQDLGEPGLRKAKQQYHPHMLVEKFRIKFRR